MTMVGRRGFVSGIVWGKVGLMSGARLRLCVVGEGFHPLHWKMLSWLVVDFCTRVFRVLRREEVVCGVSGGRILCVARERRVGGLGGQCLGVMVVLCCRAFLGGRRVFACGDGRFRFGACVIWCFRLREEGGFGEVVCVSLMVMGTCRRNLRRVWTVVGKVGMGLVSARMSW